MKLLLTIVAAFSRRQIAVLLAGVFVATGANAQDRFDFWVVSLAWSPEFCHEQMEYRGEPQCAEAHGFVLASLEPWTATGPVKSCVQPDSNVPADVLDWIMDTMLNRRWVQSQWRQQGGCAGLEPSEYFIEAQYLGHRVGIPRVFEQPLSAQRSDVEQIREDFVEANANARLTAESVSLRCERGWLREVRFCVDRDHRYRACNEPDEASHCGPALKVRGIDSRLKPPTYYQ